MIAIPKKTLRNGFSMPILGLGTWGMGGWVQRDDSHDKEDVAAIQYAIEAGITHIDTAERYAEGHAEELVGQAIRGMDRSRLLLVSKASPEHFAYDDLLRTAEASLARLGTPYLDIYLLHDPNPAIPLKETMRAMDRLVNEGLIRHIGLSNFGAEGIKEAQQYAKHPIVANQMHYNLLIRTVEQQGLLEQAKKDDWLLIAWRPIRDVLRMENPPEILGSLCRKYGKTKAQIALSWVLSQENVVTLTKCGSREHIAEALGALGWVMDEADIERLRANFLTPSPL